MRSSISRSGAEEPGNEARNLVIGIPLLQTKRLLTQHIRESLEVTQPPFPIFWVGPGDRSLLISVLLSFGPR